VSAHSRESRNPEEGTTVKANALDPRVRGDERIMALGFERIAPL
jgi:hypothetical protein